MLFLLQALAVLVPAAFALFFLLLVIGPAFGGIVYGRTFTIKPWHAFGFGICIAVALALAVAFGWVNAP